MTPQTPSTPDKYYSMEKVKQKGWFVDIDGRTIRQIVTLHPYMTQYIGELKATDVVSETPSSGESTTLSELAKKADKHTLPQEVTPSNELENIIADIEQSFAGFMRMDAMSHTRATTQMAAGHVKQQIQAWSDQRCIEARIDELNQKMTLNLALLSSADYKAGFNEALDQIDNASNLRILELQATLTPNDHSSDTIQT